VKVFSDYCLKEGIPVFVIDPRILEALISNTSVKDACTQHCPSWCQYLCRDAEVTTFGVLDQFWRKTVIFFRFCDIWTSVFCTLS